MTRVWRPLSGCNNDGIMLDRAEDVYVYDVFSKRYFDANICTITILRQPTRFFVMFIRLQL